MVSAFATGCGISLAQIKVDGKSNEITAFPELLDMLDIEGCTISIDAKGCQKDIASKIISKKADSFRQSKIISRRFAWTLFWYLNIVPQMMILQILMQAMDEWKPDAQNIQGYLLYQSIPGWHKSYHSRRFTPVRLNRR